MPNYHSRVAAAAFLTERGWKTAPATLAKKAVTGLGPPYRTWGGRALYDEADLISWAELQLGPKIRSTAGRNEAHTHHPNGGETLLP